MTTEVKIVNIEGSCLLSRDSHSLLIGLAELCGRLDEGITNYKAVLLIQSAVSGYGDEPWYFEVSSDLLIDDLKERVDLVRKVIDGIRASGVPWYYATATDCLGGFFELALSCREIMAFDENLSVGFPDIPGGLFPFAGVFETEIALNRKQLGIWLEKPVKPVSDAVLSGQVAFAIVVENMEKAAIDWIILDLIRSRDRVKVNKHASHARFSTRFFARDSAKILTDLHKEYLSGTIDSSFQTCLEIARSSKIRKEHRSELLTSLCAHQIFSSEYLNKLYKRLQQDRITIPRAKRIRTLKPLLIKVDTIIPPAFSLLRVLKAGGTLILTADTEDALKRGIEVAFLKVSRLSDQDLLQLWDRGVQWGVKVSNKGLLSLSSLANDTLVIDSGKKSLVFQRASNEPWDSYHSICEVHRSKDKMGFLESISWILPLIGDLVILTRPIGNGKMHCSTFLKSMIFEELIKATTSGISFEIVLTGLTQLGWGAIGSLSEWDRYLSNRHAIYGHDSSGYTAGVCSLDQTIWEVGTIKESVQVAASLSPNSKPFNPEDISNRIVLVCGIVAHCLFENGHVDLEWSADVLCGAASGFPSQYGSPLTRFSQLGWRRVLFDLKRDFPELSDGLTKFI